MRKAAVPGAPKPGKDGKPLRNKKGKIVYEPYQIKVFNTINFKKSMHYNPFAYLHSEKDILKSGDGADPNTKGKGKSGDDFWVKAETLLYTAFLEMYALSDFLIMVFVMVSEAVT